MNRTVFALMFTGLLTTSPMLFAHSGHTTEVTDTEDTTESQIDAAPEEETLIEAQTQAAQTTATETAKYPHGHAANETLHDTMHQIEADLKKFKNATSVEAAQQALEDLQQQVTASEHQVPDKLKDLAEDSPQRQDYQQTIHDLGEEVSKALDLVKANQLNDAKKHIAQMNELKMAGHIKFR